MNKSDNNNFLEFKPQLINGSNFSITKDKQYILYHPNNNEVIKLKNSEYQIVSNFLGKKTILEILEEKFSASFTLKISQIINIIYELEEKQFLTNNFVKKESHIKKSIIKKLQNLNFFNIEIPLFTFFSKPHFYKINKYCFNNITSLIFIIFSLLTLIFLATHNKENLGIIFNNSINIKFFIKLYLIFSIIFSLKNLLAALIIATLSKNKIKIVLNFFYGLIYISYKKSAHQKLPFNSMTNLAIIKIFTPIALIGFYKLIAFKYNLIIDSTFINALFIMFILQISPFFKNDFFDFLIYSLKKSKTNLKLGKIYLFQSIYNYTFEYLSQNSIFILTIYSIIWFIYSFTIFYMNAHNIILYFNYDYFNILSYLIIYFLFYTPIITTYLFNKFNINKNIIENVLNNSAKKNIDKISEKLKNKIHFTNYDKKVFLENIPLFSDYSQQELNELAENTSIERYNKNEVIISSGEYGEYFYIIFNGQVDVVIYNNNGNKNIIKTLSSSEMFGEIALIMDIPRTATIITKTSTTLFQIDKTTFYNYILYREEKQLNITEFIRLSSFLLKSSIFENLTAKQIKNVIKKLKKTYYRKDEIIFRQGDIGDNWYIIYSGKINIHRVENGINTLDINLTEGDYFGEIALLKNTIRTATASIKSDDAIIFYLNKKEFLDIIDENISVAIEVDATTHERLYQLGSLE